MMQEGRVGPTMDDGRSRPPESVVIHDPVQELLSLLQSLSLGSWRGLLICHGRPALPKTLKGHDGLLLEVHPKVTPMEYLGLLLLFLDGGLVVNGDGLIEGVVLATLRGVSVVELIWHGLVDHLGRLRAT